MPATDEYWRSLPRMHKWFAVSAIVLLGCTLLMMYKDEARGWKQLQAQAEQLRVDRLDRQIEDLNDGEHQEQVEALTEKISAAQKEWEAKEAGLNEKDRELRELEGRVQFLARESKGLNAKRDKARADFDIAVRDQVAEEVLVRRREDFALQEDLARKMALEAEQAKTAHQELKNELQAASADYDNAKAELVKLQADLTALYEQRKLLRPDDPLAAWKRKFKEWPIINGFNPHLKIQYDWPSELKQQLGMARVSRVDRCRTCHVNISEFGAGNVANYPQGEYAEPFCSHPNGDLYLTSTSPHPVGSFGCTICHDGNGSGTSFQAAEHTPSDPVVAEKWAHEQHWHPNHFWEYPMFSKQFVESSCLRCHHNVVELGVNKKFGNSAPKVFKGYNLIREYGCFGCHEINGFDGDKSIGPDMRLEPQTAEEAARIAADPNLHAGLMRKVGPSLRHIDSKTTPEFVAYWTAEPKRFRPTTRMPQFFGLSNQHDEMAALMQPIELAAIASFLSAKSEAITLDQPAQDYVPNAERGEQLFKKRGCLACHSKSGEEFAGIHEDFGPDLSRVHEKLKPGEEGFRWLYTWIREPSRYHARTKMPDLFLTPYEEGGTQIDPAADIAQYLLQGGPGEFPALAQAASYSGLVTGQKFGPDEVAQQVPALNGITIEEVIDGSPAKRAEVQVGDKWVVEPIDEGDVLLSWNGTTLTNARQLHDLETKAAAGTTVNVSVSRNGAVKEKRLVISTPLDDLVRLYLSKSLTKLRLEGVFVDKRYPVNAEMYAEGKSLSDFIKGDEIELAPRSLDEQVSDEEWTRRKMQYVGRRTISRYGCYGCHDIPQFETARPIGTALQDWGRKDTSKLAFEHIHEFLHHHGEPDGSSTAARLEKAVHDKMGGDRVSETVLTEAALYSSAINHGRAGFLWQKLREPRSYDYMKTETKGWDERLRMPKFPFSETDIEAVSTFVLGLVADPPPTNYIYQPDGAAGAIIEGERLLTKYNCAGCHMLEMPVWEFGVELDNLNVPALAEGEEKTFDLLKHLKPPLKGLTGKTMPGGEQILRVTGYPQALPDPEEALEDQMYSFVLWDAVDLGDGRTMLPGQPLPVAVPNIHSRTNGRGGDLAQWLIPQLVGNERGVKDINEAWQAAPPPLVMEGKKVQTPWLYQFLKNPEQLRFTTVLRMPRFNMDDDEARALANYFAAVDGAPFPYQSVPPRQPEVQQAEQQQYLHDFPDSKEKNYLDASWLVLNGPLCRKCHSVGGNPVTETDPSQVKRGPNLQRVERRLQPEYVQLWINNPKWVLPYTSMPVNFPPGGKSSMTELFAGENLRQAQAVVDALFNYTALIEAHGVTTYNPPGAPDEGGAAAPAPGTAKTAIPQLVPENATLQAGESQ
ncbi:c-type cytochrome [Planctomicrobium sp. SH664]|uniref:c-type cytochrome n=1 Tax=Planctomicrobium sp. SH664 TaxID=3448125 RepID=UPI003F5AF7A0